MQLCNIISHIKQISFLTHILFVSIILSLNMISFSIVHLECICNNKTEYNTAECTDANLSV